MEPLNNFISVIGVLAAGFWLVCVAIALSSATYGLDGQVLPVKARLKAYCRTLLWFI
jgi:hypothetical protein